MVDQIQLNKINNLLTNNDHKDYADIFNKDNDSAIDENIFISKEGGGAGNN